MMNQVGGTTHPCVALAMHGHALRQMRQPLKSLPLSRRSWCTPPSGPSSWPPSASCCATAVRGMPSSFECFYGSLHTNWCAPRPAPTCNCPLHLDVLRFCCASALPPRIRARHDGLHLPGLPHPLRLHVRPVPAASGKQLGLWPSPPAAVMLGVRVPAMCGSFQLPAAPGSTRADAMGSAWCSVLDAPLPPAPGPPQKN